MLLIINIILSVHPKFWVLQVQIKMKTFIFAFKFILREVDDDKVEITA